MGRERATMPKRPEWEVETSAMEGILERLGTFMKPFTKLFARREQSEHARTYVAGRLRPLPRRTIEPIATANDQQRRPLQKFVGAAPWDDEAVMREMRGQVTREIGSPNGVLIMDSSGFQKKGTKSVGVNRQYLGRLGKQENCQVGEFVAYAANGSSILVDRRLYLPRDWAEDADRRTECYVPPEIEFRTGSQLAVEMILKNCRELPHRWVVGDDTYGRCKETRDALNRAKEQYLLEVPANTQIELVGRDGKRSGKFLSVSAWEAEQRRRMWRKFRVRDGEKGPIKALAIRTLVYTKRDPPKKGRVEMLCVVKRLGNDAKTWYYLSGTTRGVSLREMVRAASCRHAVEESLELGKGEAGLAEYEVRSWIGWHHHMTLSILALWFTVLEHRRGKKTLPRSPSHRFAGLSASSSRIPIGPSRPSYVLSARNSSVMKTRGGITGGHDAFGHPRVGCASVRGAVGIGDRQECS